MSATPSPIGWWYRLTIPWFWLVVALISWRYPGDEYAMFGVANGLPSAWISVWIGVSGEPDDVIPIMIACSLLSMVLVSWAMDRLRVPWWLVIPGWTVAAVVLFRLAYGSFESHARAIAKNGSLTAYVSASSNLGLFLACAGAIVLVGGYRAGRRLFTARSASDG